MQRGTKAELKTGLITPQPTQAPASRPLVKGSLEVFPQPYFLPPIFLLSFLLRVYHLGNESLWRDEVYSVEVARLSVSEIIQFCRVEDVHPPLYYLILHFWIALWGDSDFAVRFPSAIFGSVAPWALFRVGATLFNKNVGVLGALILTFSEFHIQYSQEARSYSLMALLAVLSFDSFILLLRGNNRFAPLRYLCVTALLLYTHVYGFFLLLSHNLYILLLFCFAERPPKISLKTWLLLQACVFLAYFPWIDAVIQQTLKVQGGFWITRPNAFAMANSLATYSGSRFSLVFFLTLILLPLALTVLDRRRRKPGAAEQYGVAQPALVTASATPDAPPALLLVCVWLLTPLLLPFLISQFASPIYLTRGTIGASPALYLLLAHALDTFKRNTFLHFAAISLVLVFSAVNVWRYHGKIKKEQWREIVQYVDSQTRRGELLLFHEALCQGSFDYYARRTDLVKKSLQEEPQVIDKTKRKEVEKLVVEHGAIWIILCGSRREKKETAQLLLAAYPWIFHRQYVKVELFRLAFSP